MTRRLRCSLFPNCPPYLHFISPGEEYEEGEEELQLSVTVARDSSQSVLDCFLRLGASLVPWSLNTDLTSTAGPAWDHVLVCEKGHFVPFHNLHEAVKVNAFPSTSALDRKNKLWTCYTRLQAKMGRRKCNFIPENYNLPQQIHQLRAKMRSQTGSIWIVKPPGEMCGNGIRLVTEPGQVLDSRMETVRWRDPAHADVLYPRQSLTVQRYVSNPLLVNGLKFDLRLYVLLTSVSPIRLYLYDDGLVRFATKPFNTNKRDLGDKFIHLTNYAVNKDSDSFQHNSEPGEFQGHKWSLKTFWKYLDTRGCNWARLWDKIKIIVVKTIICAHSEVLESFKQHNLNSYNCYKLFGVDILIDDKLKPWLLELNNYPSLCQTALDREGLGETAGAGVGDVIAEDQLTSGDVRMLIQTEEEFSQTRGFTRLLPDRRHTEYLHYLQADSESDLLLARWEEKYHQSREEGRQALARLCLRGVHLQ